MACFGLGEEDERAAITQLPRKYNVIRTCRYDFWVYDDKLYCLQIRKKGPLQGWTTNASFKMKVMRIEVRRRIRHQICHLPNAGFWPPFVDSLMCLCEAGLELVVVGEGIVLASFRLSNAQASLSCGLLAMILLLEAADEVAAMLMHKVSGRAEIRKTLTHFLKSSGKGVKTSKKHMGSCYSRRLDKIGKQAA